MALWCSDLAFWPFEAEDIGLNPSGLCKIKGIIMENCFLCKENEGLMDFNCYSPALNELIKGDICEKCYIDIGDDMTIGARILKERAILKKIELPTTLEVLKTLCER